MADGWFLVETSGDAPAVVMVGPRAKQWRPVSNMFRGPVYTTVLHLLETVLNNLRQSQVLIDLGGPRLALAQPVMGPTRQVHAILMWVGDATEIPPPEPPVRAWAWDLSDAVSPEFVGDADAGTMTDWLSTCVRVSDVARTVNDVQSASVGDRFAGDWILTSGDVERYTMRVVATFDGPWMLGVSVRLPDTMPPMDDDMLPRAALQALAEHTHTAVSVVHVPTGRVVAWLTDARPAFSGDVLSGRVPAPTPSRTAPLGGSDELVLAMFEARVIGSAAP